MSHSGMSVAILEKNLPTDRINPLIEALDMNPKRFMATVLLACERAPKLMNFPVQQHIAWASSAAALGLEPDGVTGQAYPIPFGNKVQLIVGYRGFTSMAGRSGITINSGVLLEGDVWEKNVHAGSPFAVQQAFGDRATRNLVGVWAQAQMPNGAYAHPLLLDLSEVMAVKAKAPGGRKSDSPWNDVKVGFPAMAQKTAVRRLQRTLPALITPGRTWSTHNTGAAMDMLHEEAGQATRVDLDGHLHAEAGPIIDATVEAGVEPVLLLPNGNEVKLGTFANHDAFCRKLLLTEPEVVKAIHEKNKDRLAQWATSDNADANAAAVAIVNAILERTA